ncbi:hypothetical protein [Metasolibacillus meyeri]|uniref:hypothetical protein n=1 Tax=Metasolibacillus meyeri TaxID=1071052 RepID=UPI000D2FB11F|nr:hypothetical protein [Metasolibacillus meyeri]
MPTMPKPLSQHEAYNELYFETNGSRNTGDYDVILHIPKQSPVLIGEVRGNKSNGLKQARLIICNYLINYVSKNKDFIFNQYCVSPEREESKNEWNQFKISDFI